MIDVGDLLKLIQEYMEKKSGEESELEDPPSVRHLEPLSSDPVLRHLQKHFGDKDHQTLVEEFGQSLENAEITSYKNEEKTRIPMSSEVSFDTHNMENERLTEMGEQLSMTNPCKWIDIEMEYALIIRGVKKQDNMEWVVRSLTKRPQGRMVNVNKVYEFKSCLKRGSYCTVNRYYSNILKKDVAIKCISKNKVSCEYLTKFISREISVCLKIKHPNIIEYIETFECQLKIYLVMEVATRGSLTKFIKERGKLDSVVYQKFFMQLTDAISFCLGLEIFHRKICCDNILVTESNDIKLCDFSFAIENESDKDLFDTYCGVLAFTAPEILECKPYSPYLTEVWSIGVVVYCMVYGVLPFNPTNYSTLLKQVKTVIQFKRYPDTPYACIYLMHNMIAPVKRRFALHMVMNSPWLQKRKTMVDAPQKWPQPIIEPWGGIKEKIENLKKKLDNQIMENMRNFTPTLHFEKLEKMANRKTRHEKIPDRAKWLYEFYNS